MSSGKNLKNTLENIVRMERREIATRYNYAQWDAGLLVYHAGAKAPSLVWRSGPAAFDWSRAKIAASGDSAYILYDYTQCDTGLLVYHAGAKAPVMVWSSGIGEFDWNKATIGASDEPPPPAPVVGGNDMTKVYYSDNEWSGEGKEFSRWYTFRTPPAPEGYIVDGSPKYELVGDRSCGSYAECRAAAQPDVRGVVTVQFRMQGHDEGPLQWGVRAFGINTHDKNKDGISFYTEGRKATSLLIVTVNYRKK